MKNLLVIISIVFLQNTLTFSQGNKETKTIESFNLTDFSELFSKYKPGRFISNSGFISNNGIRDLFGIAQLNNIEQIDEKIKVKFFISNDSITDFLCSINDEYFEVNPNYDIEENYIKLNYLYVDKLRIIDYEKYNKGELSMSLKLDEEFITKTLYDKGRLSVFLNLDEEIITEALYEEKVNWQSKYNRKVDEIEIGAFVYDEAKINRDTFINFNPETYEERIMVIGSTEKVKIGSWKIINSKGEVLNEIQYE